MSLSRSAALAALLFSFVSSPTWAQPKAAVTDPALADADFALQGEYVGRVHGTAVGLQVVALGKGKFDASAATKKYAVKQMPDLSNLPGMGSGSGMPDMSAVMSGEYTVKIELKSVTP